MRSRRRDSERGYALLFVFVMAAFVAMSLYMEMPRVLFEGQRAKEQLLIDRGNEYKRAIKVFVRKNQGRYPPTIDALVETNDIRFLRKKFKDPMTGKDEWRLIHIGPGGMFPDSLTMAPPKSNQNAFSSSGSEEPTPQALWAQTTRPSDRAPLMPGQMTSPMEGEQGQEQMQPGQQPPQGYPPAVSAQGQPQPGDAQQQAQGQTPGQMPPYPTQNVPGLPGPYGQQNQPGQPGVPAQPMIAGQPLYPGQPGFPGQPGMPPSGPGTMTGTGALPPGAGAGPRPSPGAPSMFAPQSLQSGGSAQQFQPGNFGPPSGLTGGPPRPPQPGGGGSQIFTPLSGSFTTNDPQSAQQMINSMLRGGGGGGGSGSNTFGGLIAGVASQSEFEGIKTIDGRAKYKEWEFIYDMRREMMPGMAPGQRGFQGQGRQQQLGVPGNR